MFFDMGAPRVRLESRPCRCVSRKSDGRVINQTKQQMRTTTSHSLLNL